MKFRPLHDRVVVKRIDAEEKTAGGIIMITGRKRVRAPSRMAAFVSEPASANLRICVSMTSPLSTATPESAMKPTAAEIEKGIPRNHNAAIPPVSARGTALKTSRASRGEPSAPNNSR